MEKEGETDGDRARASRAGESLRPFVFPVREVDVNWVSIKLVGGVVLDELGESRVLGTGDSTGFSFSLLSDRNEELFRGTRVVGPLVVGWFRDKAERGIAGECWGANEPQNGYRKGMR